VFFQPEQDFTNQLTGQTKMDEGARAPSGELRWDRPQHPQQREDHPTWPYHLGGLGVAAVGARVAVALLERKPKKVILPSYCHPALVNLVRLFNIQFSFVDILSAHASVKSVVS